MRGLSVKLLSLPATQGDTMEYRELYDENRNPLGIAIAKGETVPANAYMLTVGIWIVNDQKQILLTRRSLEKRYAPGMWENPAGHVQKGETCEDAIIRELREETGATAEKFISLGELYPTPGYCGEIIWLYAATGLTFGETDFDDDEFLTVERIPLDKCVEMILSGEIKDAKTQTAVLKLKLLKDCGRLD